METPIYQVIIEPMQTHINQGRKLEKTFSDICKSLFYFSDVADQKNCTVQESDSDNEIEAGGIGFDYRITWRRI